MVQTTVLPVSTVFRTVLITIAAALASRPEVGSSMNIMEGFATSSTAMVILLRCSVERPSTPGNPWIKYHGQVAEELDRSLSCSRFPNVDGSHRMSPRIHVSVG